MKPRTDPAVRFWSKVEFTETCWLWTGGQQGGGYGHFMAHRESQYLAHRYAYAFCVGEIPHGLTIDHLCRIRNCVNPDHLEAVTQKENAARGMAPSMIVSRSGVCKKGHAIAGRNAKAHKNGFMCRRCRNDYMIRYRARRRGKVAS